MSKGRNKYTNCIVKIQLPIVSNDPKAGALIYAQGRALSTQQGITPDVVRKMKGSLKAFFYADYNHGQARWHIKDLAPYQDW